MQIWWASLSVLEHACLYIAIPATLILLLQTALTLLGLGVGGAEDADGDPGDMGMDTNSGDDPGDGGPFEGLRLLTVRGVIAFLSILGWGGLWLLHMGLAPLLALFLAVAMGIWAMLLLALLLRALYRLQSDGTVRPARAIGLPATIYLTVPASRGAAGKITVLVQERLCEFDAVTDDESALLTGQSATVVGVLEEGTLVVSRRQENQGG